MTSHHVVILDCFKGCPTSIRIEAEKIDIASNGCTNVTCNRCDVPMVVRPATMERRCPTDPENGCGPGGWRKP